jgi:outer membrane protein OmpA-like peptidoglycan-associated protein
VFEPVPGAYAGPQLVTLSTPTPRAVIHYTTDGSKPTSDSPIYTGPIRVDSGITIKALAVAPDMPASEISGATYTIAPPSPPTVAIARDKLELKERILFDTGRATLKPVSLSLLDGVVSAVKKSPDLKKIVIEGHTDSRGSRVKNLELSQGRAEAVRAYLVEKGVEPGRLDAKGFGASRPIADNATPRGREDNRRVEFTILRP